MKKKIIALVLVICTLAALAIPAMAAAGDTISGVYNVKKETGFSLTIKNAGGETLSPITATIDSEDWSIYEGAVKFDLTYDSAETYALVFVLDNSSGSVSVPDSNNIRYIDQDAGKKTITFAIYPDKLEDRKEYTIYVNGSTGLVKAASFSYSTTAKVCDYLLGDVDNNKVINTLDALQVLRKAAGLITFDDRETLAANVDGNAFINSLDALQILRYSAGLIANFD